MTDIEYAKSQSLLLQSKYRGLKITEENDANIHLCGIVEVFRTACNFTVHKNYDVEVVIPENPSVLPYIIDKGHSIDPSYPHRYVDGRLCLETNTAIQLRFIDGFNILEWMDEFVEPYYFSYEYYTRYGCFPFGERPHGFEGLLQTYQDHFSEADPVNAWKLMIFAAEGIYRGHLLCPCGSGKKLRGCHGKYIFPFMEDKARRAILRRDIFQIRKEVEDNQHISTNNSSRKY